jgi:AraC-like DNA-binding protein
VAAVTEPRSLLSVPAELQPWVAEISVSTLVGEPRTLTEVPEPDVTLLIRQSGDGHTDAVVAGPRSHAFHYPAVPGPSCTQLRLRPGRLPAGIDLGRGMVNRVASFPEGREIDTGRLLDLLTEGDRWDATHSDLLEKATELLTEGMSVPTVARRLDVSERHLRNIFTRTIGLSPKQYGTVQRVRSVVEALDHRGLADAAADAGYFDQAHMTTEFRRVMGITPGAYAAGRRPSPALCDHAPVSGGAPTPASYARREHVRV